MSNDEQEFTVAVDEVNAIIGGYHGDPFHVLGPHTTTDGIVVRAFLPQARQVVLIAGEERRPLTQTHEHGFFEVQLPGWSLPVDYRFEIAGHNGEQQLIEDPYRFSAQLSEDDRYLHAEGKLLKMYDSIGAHLHEADGRSGVLFTVWAPSALRVSVIGDFNQWDGRRHPMRFHPGSALWELFVPGLHEGTLYKFEIKTRYKDYTVAKADPVGFAGQMRPNNASMVWNMNKYEWHDQTWLQGRPQTQSIHQPISVYEVHLGSWRKKEVNGEWHWLTYTELAQELIPYVQEMGYTHIELLPVSEFPFDGSWGYQVTGYFAPTSRYGNPDEFMAFVDACHQAGIGVILDWVPAHFPMDEHGLGFFDGTHLYEHEDPRKGSHPDWGTYIFNYGRNEVRQFLISNAIFWLEKYHIDGLRVDAVASMLYLDFSREHGEWIPNQYGGRENIDAINFIREFNNQVHEQYPGVLTIAEESTSWPGVTHDTADNGLGFNLKWNMGWMHDTLQYFSNEPVYRSFHQGTLTFSLLYAFSEKFMLPFSHDEVVHLKRSMLDKMPGDVWQKFANLRLLYSYQWSHPGKKLLFMGGEFGQWQEWSEARSLDWHLLDGDAKHAGLKRLVRDLNNLYRYEKPLHELDDSWEGFEWIDYRDSYRSILAYARIAPSSGEKIIAICNFTPVVRYDYRIGVPEGGVYKETFNSDADIYGGSHVINAEPMASEPINWNNRSQSISLTLPPLACVYLKKV